MYGLSGAGIGFKGCRGGLIGRGGHGLMPMTGASLGTRCSRSLSSSRYRKISRRNPMTGKSFETLLRLRPKTSVSTSRDSEFNVRALTSSAAIAKPPTVSVRIKNHVLFMLMPHSCRPVANPSIDRTAESMRSLHNLRRTHFNRAPLGESALHDSGENLRHLVVVPRRGVRAKIRQINNFKSAHCALFSH